MKNIKDKHIHTFLGGWGGGGRGEGGETEYCTRKLCTWPTHGPLGPCQVSFWAQQNVRSLMTWTNFW